MTTTDRTAIRRGLAVRGRANRPPWRWGEGHRPRILPPARNRRERGRGRERERGWGASPAKLTAGIVVGAVGAVGIGLGLMAMARARRERSAARARRFGLLAGEPPAQGLRRIVLAQLDIAIELLRGESGGLAQEEAVHEARKAFKRLRTLMRLLQDALGAETAGRELEILRDAGRQLAGARDAEVLVATLDDVLSRAPRKLRRRRAVRELRAQLEREREEATRRMLEDTATRARVVTELEGMRARAAAWRLPERAAIELAGPGLERIYRAGDLARRRARKAGKRDARAMHRWRKHAKELRYALEALGSEDSANKRIGTAAHRADALGETLGEDHDLVVLAERVQALQAKRERRRGGRGEGRARRARRARTARRARKARKARKRLLREIERRRAKLRARALRVGAKLYEHKPGRFVRRLRL